MGRRSRKKRQTDRSDIQGPPSPPAPLPSTGEGRRFRGWRGWLLRLSLLVLSPILFFGLLEAGLRLGGYGYPTGFFLGPDAGGTCTTNYRFGWRFFPRWLATDPHPCILAAKPAGKVRIFVLGGSAAMGTPDPSFNFGQILGVMLREQYPGVQFEVVNGAMTAINSYVVREIAGDCAAREPDLFVVYMGNNEVIGPYGPGTVFGAPGGAPSTLGPGRGSPGLGMIRASLWAKSTRVGELLGDVVACFRGKQNAPGHWRGVEMFLNNPVTADDPRLAAVYDNFRRNLTDICRLARRGHAAVVLSTVAVNLRDCPPLASLHRADLTPEELTQWESLYKAGGALEAGNRWQEAIQQYEAAAKIDDRFAELQYRIGRCLMEAVRSAEAAGRFELARDLDVLRFRADSHINAIIREVAAEQAAAGVRLADAQRALAQSDADAKGISAGDLFYEHVHLTFAGNYLLARAVFEQVTAALPQLAAVERHGTIPSRQRCADLLALTPWDEYQLAGKMAGMTSRAPFTNQLDHGLRQAAVLERLEELRRLASTPEAMQAAWKTYEAALAKGPDDWSLHGHFGALALAGGRADVAVEHLRIALGKIPWDAPLHHALGDALAAQGQVSEAIAQYRQALEFKPDDLDAHNSLGLVLAGCGKLDEAILQYRQALEIKPDHAAAHYNLANALARRGQADEAIAQYEKALEIRSDYAAAHNNLGLLVYQKGQVDEAIAHFQKALEIEPDDAEVHYNLGRALAGRGQVEAAIAQYQKALEIKPDFVPARRSLEAARVKHK